MGTRTCSARTARSRGPAPSSASAGSSRSCAPLTSAPARSRTTSGRPASPQHPRRPPPATRRLRDPRAARLRVGSEADAQRVPAHRGRPRPLPDHRRDARVGESPRRPRPGTADELVHGVRQRHVGELVCSECGERSTPRCRGAVWCWREDAGAGRGHARVRPGDRTTVPLPSGSCPSPAGRGEASSPSPGLRSAGRLSAKRRGHAVPVPSPGSRKPARSVSLPARRAAAARPLPIIRAVQPRKLGRPVRLLRAPSIRIHPTPSCRRR